MADASTRQGLQLRSTVKKEGIVEISLATAPTPEPKPEEVVVRIDASPINPSDQGLLFGGADMSTAKASGTADNPVVTASILPGGHEIDGRASRAVAARRQRSGRRGRPGGLLTGRASADGEDCRDPRRRHVRAVPRHQGRPMPGAAAGHHTGRGRRLLRQSAHRARDGRDHARRGSQGARAHGGGLQSRADAQQDLHQGQGRRW